MHRPVGLLRKRLELRQPTGPSSKTHRDDVHKINEKVLRIDTMNKKNSLIALLLLFALILTACGTSSKSSTPTSKTAGKLPTQTKLVLGTINLEETDYAVTAEQATELLPVFYVLQELNESGSAAQEEIDGLVSQIQQTLTDDQIQAIDDMSLSMKDIAAITQVNSSSNTLSASSTSGASGGGAGGPPDMGVGGMPGGGMPGGAIPSTGNTSASSNTGAASVMDISTPSALFDIAIKLLQKKVQS
jgi:hypothetical protein